MRSRFTSRDRPVTNSPELSLNAFSNRRPRTSLGQSLCYNARYPTWSVESPGFSETIRQKIVQDTVYTIGHSNHDWDSFSALLKTHGIEILVDTRSRTRRRGSRRSPITERCQACWNTWTSSTCSSAARLAASLPTNPSTTPKGNPTTVKCAPRTSSTGPSNRSRRCLGVRT